MTTSFPGLFPTRPPEHAQVGAGHVALFQYLIPLKSHRFLSKKLNKKMALSVSFPFDVAHYEN